MYINYICNFERVETYVHHSSFYFRDLRTLSWIVFTVTKIFFATFENRVQKNMLLRCIRALTIAQNFWYPISSTRIRTRLRDSTARMYPSTRILQFRFELPDFCLLCIQRICCTFEFSLERTNLSRTLYRSEF